MRKLVFTVLASVLMVSMTLVGCSKSQQGSDSSKPVEITLWGGYPELDPWYQKMANEYKTAHPNVTVTISSFPLRDYEKKVSAALPSNSAANIVSLDPYMALR